MLSSVASPEAVRAAPPPRLAVPAGGLLVVSGPPLGGKGPLAARLHEALPESVKLELQDNLSSGSPYAGDDPPDPEGIERALLEQVPAQLAALRGPGPVVIVVARLDSPSLRKEAAALASRLEVRFLLVEALSTPAPSIRRLSRMFLSAEETAARLVRHREALAAYRPLTDRERARLPAITLKTALTDVERATLLALAAWRER